MSPTQRSIAALKAENLPVGKLEGWNQFARRRQDVFGFDLVTIYKGRTTWIQTTTGENASHRAEKLRELPTTAMLIQAGDRVLIHGWKKRGERGKRKVWTCRILQGSLQAGVVAFVETDGTESLDSLFP